MKQENIQIHKTEESDRFIQVTRKEGVIIGINYCQGISKEDLQHFKQNYLTSDEDLTNYVLDRLPWNSPNEVKDIDKLIWDYAIKEQLSCEINEKIEQQISEIVQENCKSGDVSLSQTLKLEEYTNKLAELVAEIVANNQ